MLHNSLHSVFLSSLPEVKDSVCHSVFVYVHLDPAQLCSVFMSCADCALNESCSSLLGRERDGEKEKDRGRERLEEEERRRVKEMEAGKGRAD